MTTLPLPLPPDNPDLWAWAATTWWEECEEWKEAADDDADTVAVVGDDEEGCPEMEERYMVRVRGPYTG